jgi:ABC-type Fe3+-hydroxamate transport system substrate-binding protein
MRRLTLLPALMATALLLASCGDDAEPASTASQAAPGFPVTVEHKLGAATIEAEPKRVVALDYPSADAVIALGVTPVAMYRVGYVEGGIQTWTKAALGGERPELLDTDSGIPLEKLAALRPDLIVATNTYPLIADVYDKLSAIAPVVGHIQGPGVDTWQEDTLAIAKALGREQQGEGLVAAAEAKVAKVRADHPEFGGEAVSFFNYVPGDGLYVINDESDASIRFMTDLGFRGISEQVAGLPGSGGRAQVSPERYDLLDAGVVLGTSPDPKALDELEHSRLFSFVPAVKRGAFVGLELGPATAMAFPSVLSVPYAVDELVPELASAVE